MLALWIILLIILLSFVIINMVLISFKNYKNPQSYSQFVDSLWITLDYLKYIFEFLVFCLSFCPQKDVFLLCG